jgi:hypothetical protein
LNSLTHRLFARTVCFTASTNCSTVGAGMQIRSAPAIIRKAFSSGRKSNIDPSTFLYAFKPSNNPYEEKKKQKVRINLDMHCFIAAVLYELKEVVTLEY